MRYLRNTLLRLHIIEMSLSSPLMSLLFLAGDITQKSKLINGFTLVNSYTNPVLT
jgi:hypothetical protein